MAIVRYKLYIDWDRDGTFTEETARLVTATGNTRIGSPEDSIASPRGQIGQMKITLNNGDNRYSVLNSSSAIYTQIAGGAYYQVPVYLQVNVSDSNFNWYRVFTGVIKGPTEKPVTWKEGGTITFDCRSREDIILQRRTSTSHSVFQEIYEEGWTEDLIIRQWILDAGLTIDDYALDKGMFVIPWAWLDDESPIEDIWQLAAACGGVFFCDANGILTYKNMQWWANNITVTETLRKGDYQTANMRIDDGELYQSVVVHFSTRSIQPEAVVWESEDIPSVPPLSDKVITAQTQQPFYACDSVQYTAVTGGGLKMDSYISVLTELQAQRVRLTFTNSHPDRTAYLHELKIIGNAVSGGPKDDVEKVSANAFWNNRGGRTRSIRANNYIQSQDQAEALATFLRDRHELPRAFYTLNGVPGVPSRTIGNRVKLIDKTLFSGERQAFIVGINWSITDKGGYVQNLEMVDAENIFPYSTNGANNYFIIGTDTLGANSKRVFY